jgi:hypothetical protein
MVTSNNDRKSLRVLALRDSRGLSTVLTAMILCASVLTIGGTAWAFANNTSSVLQENYFDEVVVNVDKAKERFMIETIDYNAETNTTRVWAYNYGEIDVIVDVYVYYNGLIVGQTTDHALAVGETRQFDVAVNAVNVGDEFVVKMISERGNVEYESLLVR